MEINRLSFNEKQLKRIVALDEKQKKLLAIISSALVIDSLYVFSSSKGEHPLSNEYCDIADELKGKTGITSQEYAYLCGKMGIMELDGIIDFIIQKTYRS